MAFSKARQFDRLTFEQSFFAKAQAYPARIIILCHLKLNGTTSFQTLWRKLPLAKSTVSQHLKILTNAGLIVAAEEYPHTYYTLNSDICKNLAEKLNSILQVFLNEQT
jgi:DNA-binding transcriptional ArsR family regulator